MAKGPRGEKRPADVIGCAVHVARVATGEIVEKIRAPSGKVRSGLAGEKARAEKLTSEEREAMQEKLVENRSRIQEAIPYLMNLQSDLSQHDIVKSLFLADGSHINKYGRPITFDNYTAMEHGPVPSLVYDALKPSFH